MCYYWPFYLAWLIATAGCGDTLASRKYISRHTDELASIVNRAPDSEEAQRSMHELISIVNGNWCFGRCRACYALGTTGVHAAPAVADLIRAAECGDRFVEDAAIKALADIGPAAAPAVDVLVHKLELAVTHSNLGYSEFCTVYAARALGNIGSPARKAVPLLKRAMKSDDRWLADESKAALVKLGEGSATLDWHVKTATSSVE